MRHYRWITMSILLVCLMSGIGHAAYLSNQDEKVSVTVAPSLLTTSGSTGQTTFQTQEALHNQLSSTSGISVDHYYTWIYLNGEPVLAVDPAWVEAN